MSRLTERIENFNRAYLLFESMQKNFCTDKNNDTFKLALTQSFEIVFELGWKVLKDYLAVKGIDAYTPRDVIKEAFSANILPQAQIWVDMSKDRNATSHEYNMDKVNLFLERVSSIYYDELRRFKNELSGWNE